MRKFFLAILSLALVSTSPFNCFADEDTDVPVTLVVGIVEGANINGIDFYVPSTSTDGIVLDKVTVGGYKCVVKTFEDIFYDIDKIQKINNTIYKNLQSAVQIGSSKQAFAKRADLSIAYLEVFEFNQQSINQAFALKAKKLYDNGNSSSTQEQIESNSKSISELKSASDKMGDNFKAVYDTVIELNNSLKNNSSELRSELTTLVSEVEDLKKRLDSSSVTQQQKEEIFKAISEVRAVQENLTKLNGLIRYATDKCNEIASSSISVVGGGALAIPTQISTYSNQIARLTLYLGTKEKKDGLFHAPPVLVYPPDGVSFEEQDYDGEDEKGSTVNNIVQYFWQFGFLPWLPPEANGNLPEDDAVQSLYDNRYFYFTSVGDTVETHAKGITKPVEWGDERPWTLDPTTGKWKNAVVQVGLQTVSNNDLTAIEGDNYAKVNIASKTISIVSEIPNTSSSNTEITDAYFFVGKVETENEVKIQKSGSYYVPILFLYE